MSNVVLIVADDMRADLLRFMPFTNSVIRREGTQFTNMRCNVPICQAARVALLTGQYAKNTGVHQNAGGVGLSEIADWNTNLWSSWVQDTGATTGMFGKAPNGYRRIAPRPGWDTWRIFTNGATEQEAYGYTISDGAGGTTTPSTHALTTVGGLVTDFINSASSPFFAWYNPTNPHNNLTLGNEPLPGSITRYGWFRWPFTLLEDTSGKPSWISAQPQHSTAVLSAIRQVSRSMIREVRDLDGIVQNIYNALDTKGVLDDTYIILSSDSGVLLGEQRLGSFVGTDKDHPYDVVAKSPCIIRGPGIPGGQVNRTATTLQDITATIVDIFNATPTLTPDGKSLLDYIGSEDLTRSTLYERQGHATYPDAKGIVNGTRKLIRYINNTGNPAIDLATTPTDEFEMYDLDTDPQEMINVANEPGRLAERNALEAELDALLS